MYPLRPQDPRHVGDYEVLERLGSGGMGEVYLGRSPAGELVAVKVVRAEYAEDRTFRARFRKEVRAAQAIGGRYTARVVDAALDGERPWMATEYVAGPSLRDAVLDGGPLPESAVITLAGALAEALAAIHGKNMVHRDLKPANILLADDGPRVIDFGIVRALESTALTATGAIVGTVGYVSPEQIRNSMRVGPPSDVFSLGVVLAFASSGAHPFGEGSDPVVLLRIMSLDFDLSRVPDRVRHLVSACLKRAPEDRPTPAQLLALSGYTASSVRQATLPGWLPAAMVQQPAQPDEEQHWTPSHDAADASDDSRVEYLVNPEPGVTDPVPPPPSRPPTPPSARPQLTRRRVLTGLSGLAVAAAGTVSWLTLRDSSGDGQGAKPGGSNSPDDKKPGGTVLWTYPLPRRKSTTVIPAVANPSGSVLYLGTGHSLCAVNSKDGTERWSLDLGAPVSPPVVTGDGVFCVADNRLHAVSQSREKLWNKPLGAPAGMEGPTLAEGLILVRVGAADDGEVVAYSAAGDERWRHPVKATPDVALVTEKTVVYVGGTDNRLHALNVEHGTERWATALDGDVALPAVSGETIFVSTSNAGQVLHAVGTDGTKRWDEPDRGGGLYSVTATTGSIAFTVVDSALLATNADGTARWSYRPTDFRVWPDSFTAAGETVYVQAGSFLQAVDLEGSLRWQVEIGRGDTRVRPVVSRGRVYVVSVDGLVAVEVSG